MSKLLTYIKESRDELVNKVTWPSWSELQKSTTVVVIACIIISVIIFAMDKVFGDMLIAGIYSIFE